MKIHSNIFETATGSISNITASATRAGTLFNKKKRPRDVQTAEQMRVRQALKLAAVTWATYGEGPKKSWGQYGRSCKKVNSTGKRTKLTGWTAFSRSFVIFTNAGTSTQYFETFPPEPLGYQQDTPILLYQHPNQRNTIVIQNLSLLSANIIIYSGKITSKTVTSYKAGFRFRFTDYVAAESTSVRSGILVEGRNWFRVQTFQARGNASLGEVKYVDAL